MSKPIQIIIIVVCLAAAGYLIATNVSKETYVEPPKMYHFQCASESCKYEWSWEAGGSTETGLDPEVCPKCQTKDATQCAKCEACGKLHAVVGHGGSQRTCPHCGASMIAGDKNQG
jgi:hypothetical protein